MINLQPSVVVHYENTGGDKLPFSANVGDSAGYFLHDLEQYDLFLNGHTVTCNRDYVLKEGDVVHAIHRPHGSDPVTIGIAIAVITAIITVSLLPRPEKPNLQGVGKTSSNNQITGQSNIARTGEGIPDIKGEIKSFPDTIQAPWYLFQGNGQRLFQTFCIGVGDYDVSREMVGESLFSGIDSADVFKIENGVIPVSDTNRHSFVVQGTSNTEVLAPDEINATSFFFQAIAATNQVKIGAFVGADIFTGNTLFGDILQLAQTNALTLDSSPDIIQTGDYEFSGFTVAIEPVDPGGSMNVVHTFQVTNRTVVDEYVPLSTNDYSQLRRSDQDINGWSQFYQCRPSSLLTVNIQFPQGIRNSDGIIETINYEIEYDDGTTPSSLVTGSARGIPGGSSVSVTTQVAAAPSFTEITRFRVRRIEDRIENGADAMFIESAFSQEDGSGTVGNGNITGISTEYRVDRLTNVVSSSDAVSAIVARHQNSYNSATDTITAPSGLNRSFADAILSDFISLFGETRTRQILDVSSLYEVSDALSPSLRNFAYSFDDLNISLGQRIHTICNAARVGAVRDGQVWRFYREEVKDPVFVFDRRNIASTSDQSQSYRFQKPNDNDSVRLSYIDPDDDKEKHIERRIDTATQSFVEGIGNRPLEISLAGCRNVAQAIDRAELEVRRLLFQRRRVTERVLNDGQIVDIGDRVRWACIYDDTTTDAEALEISGTQVRLSEIPVFEDGSTYFAHVSDSNGNMNGPYQVSQGLLGDFWVDGIDTDKVFIANNMPSQAGSHVIIGTTDDLNYYDFTITAKVPADDETVQVEMVEYDARMFSED